MANMIDAKTLRRLKKCNVGVSRSYVEDRLIDAAFKGNNHITLPESAITRQERLSLVHNGLAIHFRSDINEYQITFDHD